LHREENWLKQHPVVTQIETADRAIVAEDFDALLEFYTDDAILVVEPGRNAVGKEAIRMAFEAIAVHFKNGLQLGPVNTNPIGTAGSLFSSSKAARATCSRST
jgi:ketosteroid isomerase-like protein